MRNRVRSIVAGSVFVLLLTGCGEDSGSRSPTAPPAQPPPSSAKGFVWGAVVEASGVCLIDAVVEIVEGSNVGQRFVQKEACTVWDGNGGYIFEDLPLGVPIRIRATKDGYRPEERQAVPFTGGPGLNIVLQKQ